MVTARRSRRSRGGGRSGPGAAFLLRGLAIGAVSLAAAWLSWAATYATALGRRAPESAARYWPVAATPKALTAAARVTEGATPASLKVADRLAREAIAREPVNVAAARTLALIAASRGDERRSVRWLRYAESLSRRDLATELALIELAVSKGRIDVALVHYDRALRTSARAAEVLFPVLVPAANDPAVARGIATVVSRRPDWWYPFTLQLVQQGVAAPSLFAITAAERLNPADPAERDVAVGAMKQMTAALRVDLAARLHDRLASRRPIGRGVRNGLFRPGDGMPPFDWELTGDADLAAAMEPRSDGRGNALYITATEGRQGVVAQQLLRLPPGRYALSWTQGGVREGSARPAVSVQCLGGGQALATRAAPVFEGRAGLFFTVAPGCAAQWLRVSATAGEDLNADRPWLARMAVTPGR